MRRLYERHHVSLHLLVLAGLTVAVYANNFEHQYLLDSEHSIEQNPYVRSLRHVPRYFADPKTLTTYRANADYRPVLQLTYALNYQLSAYRTWSWHLVQILLHLICVVALYFLCRQLLLYEPDEGGPHRRTLPAVVAGILALHPTASGVVNYLHARSSLLVAALLLPSLLAYTRPRAADARRRIPWVTTVLYTLALFVKVEAVAALAVYFLWEALQAARTRAAAGAEPASWRDGFLGDLLRAANRQTLTRLAPMLVVTVAYLVLRALVVEDYVGRARHADDVTTLPYLFTQLTAWWHYLFRWFAPVGLVADDATYPVYRSLLAPPVLLALAGWVLVAAVVKLQYRRHPHYAFLVVSALALLSPTSSVAPLGEMVNEHRPYLPLALLSLAWLMPGLRLLLGRPGRRRLEVALVAAGLALLATALFATTYARNRVFATRASYYADILKRAPSARAHVNYGLTRMAKGRPREALTHYEKALALAPRWHIVHVNLALAHERLGDARRAGFHYDQAVRFERYGGIAREYRGWYHLAHRRFGAAAQDLRRSATLCVACFRSYQGLATAYAGLGDWRRALHWTRRCRALDPQRTEKAVAPISAPFWQHAALHAAGLEYYLGIDRLLPDRWWVKTNLADLATKLGRTADAARYRQAAIRLKGRKP